MRQLSHRDLFPESKLRAHRAIHHDPDHYDRPDEFMPERYLNNEFGFKDGYNVDTSLRKTYGFGAGRRACPGQHLAENSLVCAEYTAAWKSSFLLFFAIFSSFTYFPKLICELADQHRQARLGFRHFSW